MRAHGRDRFRSEPVRISRPLLILILAAAASGLGCRQPVSPAHYLKDRVNDLADLVRISGGVGPGFDFDLCASRYLQLGIGYYDTARLGIVGREIGIWKEESFDFNVIGPFFGETNRRNLWSNVEDYPQSHERLMASVYDEDRTWLGLSGRIHALLAGVELGVEPVELADLVLGIFTIDLLKDDYYSPDTIFSHWNRTAWRERNYALKTLPACFYYFDTHDVGYVLLNHEAPEVRYFAMRELGRRREPVVLQYLTDYMLKPTTKDKRVKHLAFELLRLKTHYLFLIRRVPTERNLLAFRRWLTDNLNAIKWAEEYDNFIIPQSSQ